MDFPTARVLFDAERRGQLNSWLTEMGVADGPEKRSEWFGTLVRPPAGGKRGEWALPHWPDYEHVAGLGLLHDMWQIGGNDREIPWSWTIYLRRLMRWDDSVRFIGYWQLQDELQAQGAVPEKVACSIYYRPAGLGPTSAPPNTDVVADDNAVISSGGKFATTDAAKQFLREIGDSPRGWLILVPMNNTDADVTLTLRPNLQKLGFESARNGRLRDVYRAFDYEWSTPPEARMKPTDPESPHFEIKGHEEVFPLKDGAATVPVPKRNFRMLLLEGK